MKQASHNPVTGGDTCRFCGSSLVGAEIPEADRALYGDATHFHRAVMGMTDGYAGALYFVCPDCHRAWPRFTGVGSMPGTSPTPMSAMSNAAVTAHDEAVAALVDAEAVLSEHAEAVAFAVGISGFTWTGWVVSPLTGAHLNLLVEGNPVNANRGLMPSPAQALVRDITGLPVVIMSVDAPAARGFGDKVRLPPLP